MGFALLALLPFIGFGAYLLLTTNRRIYAWWKNGKLVVLRDFEGKMYRTIAFPYPFDDAEMHAHVYWWTETGSVLLLEGGKVGGQSTYIKEWKYE